MKRIDMMSEELRSLAIDWLVCNDSNGVYTDSDCDREDMSRLSLQDALRLVIEQTAE